MRSRFFQKRLGLIALGICLGYLARFVFGGPIAPPNGGEHHPPVVDVSDSDDSELPIEDQINETGGLVPPIHVAGIMPAIGDLGSVNTSISSEQFATNVFDQFAHDERATFHAHGEEVCASGCAASRHPTRELSEEHFFELMKFFPVEPLNQTNNSLEELVYFGPQTKAMIERHGFQGLSREYAEFLWEQLKVTHAKISIRVIDESGEIRTWLPPTSVPFDRRHVFQMETKNLQPLVTSGTVKRVGLNHIWARL